MADGYYKCDRCGKFERGPITREKSMLSDTDFADEKYRKIQFGHLTGEDESGSISKTVDLCHECRKELTDWIEN